MTAVVTLALLATSTVLMAGGPRGGRGEPGPGEMMEGRHGHIARALLGRLGDRIGLSGEQRGQIEAVVEAARPQMKALADQLRSSRQAFRESDDPAVFDEARATAFAAAQAGLHAQMMVQGMKTRAQVLAVLTEEQRAELEQVRDACEECRGRRHDGPPMD